MSSYKYQAKATREFGVTFRSQLEAKWAYALNELHDVKWDYVDCDWYDFVIHAPWGDAHIEIKPTGPKFWTQAVLRIPVGQTLFIIQGEPGNVDSDSVLGVDTLEPVSCVYHKAEEAFGSVTWHSLEIAFLQAMWHGARSYPCTQPTFFGKTELLRMDEYRDAMLEQLRSVRS